MERIIVRLPTALLEQVDRVAPNRSRFIADAVEHELKRRRRHAFLLSVQNPHPETTALVEAMLSGWMADPSSGETLVDARAGTPVRWIEGKGWTTE